MSNSKNATILVVDDERRIADTLAAIFHQAGYAVSVAYSGEDALACVAASQPSLIVTDVVMPGVSCIELAKTIRASYPNCPVLLFSGNADTEQLLNSEKEQGHVFEVLAKPVRPLQILAKVASLLEQKLSSLP